MTEPIGYLAATCTTLAFLPQVIHVWRTRSADDISLAMYLIFMVGVLAWVVYGVRLHAQPVVLANGATFVLAGAVLVGKLRFRHAG